MHVIDGQCAGRAVEGGKRSTDAGRIFQGVEPGIDLERQAVRGLEVVADLRTFVIKRGRIAERAILAEAAQVQTHAAAFATDKPAVRKIVAHGGKAAAPGITAVKARKVAVGVRTLAGRLIATEAEGPAWNPVRHRRGLGVGRSPAQTERRQYQCKT